MHKLEGAVGASLTCLRWQCTSASCMQHIAECKPLLQKLYIPLCHADMTRTCRFDAKCKRIQAESPHGRRPAWAVRPVIVKSGDDCRQELLAVQLISTFHDIFQASQLLSMKSLHQFLCMAQPAHMSMLQTA